MREIVRGWLPARKHALGWILVLALLPLGIASSAVARAPARTVLGVSCSDAIAKHYNMQLNMRASLVLQRCSDVGGKATAPPGGSVALSSAGPRIGGTDKDVIQPPDATAPHDTQSESMVAANGNTIVVNYNDSRDAGAVDYSGASISTDGGSTWSRIDPFATGHGQNFGDPIIVYNQKFGTFVAGDLVGACGGQGIGSWTSTSGSSWTVGPCIHSGSSDDRESMAVVSQTSAAGSRSNAG